MQIWHPTGGYTCKNCGPFSRLSHAKITQVADTRVQHWKVRSLCMPVADTCDKWHATGDQTEKTAAEFACASGHNNAKPPVFFYDAGRTNYQIKK